MKISLKDSQILVGVNLHRKIKMLIKKSNYSSILIFTDKNTKVFSAPYLSAFKAVVSKTNQVFVEAGEELKSLESLGTMAKHCMDLGLDRKSLIVAIGGGTVGDAVGFLAGTFMRGVDWLGIPTTMLSLVDSSVGGKVGVNLVAGKNLLGVFHSPKYVLCDLNSIATLSTREINSGLGEIIKYSFVFDAKFFNWLTKNISRIQSKDFKAIKKAIIQSLSWKAKMVDKDPCDKKGIRESLNFGHTFGHALETATDYQNFQHGEAVLWGMKFAIHLSIVKQKLHQKDANKMLHLIDQVPVPPLLPKLQFELFAKLMKKDKKAENGAYRFVLLKSIGKHLTQQTIEFNELQLAWRKMHEC
jgi:3-dehydroquinate synthase